MVASSLLESLSPCFIFVKIIVFILPGEWKYLIENRIIIKIVSLMTFHSYDLTEKYITMLSKYKEIERYFEEDQTSEYDFFVI